MLCFFSSESKITDEISHLEDDMGDMEMARAVEQMEEIKAVVLSLVPRVVESLKRKECNGCYINHGSQDQHSCLDLLTSEAEEEKMETRLDTALGHCSEELVGLVYSIYGRAMPPHPGPGCEKELRGRHETKNQKRCGGDRLFGGDGPYLGVDRGVFVLILFV